MKRLLLLLAAALSLGVGAFYASQRMAQHDSCVMPMNKTAEMRWLRSEFKLTDAQYERISALHEQYKPTCERLCARIAESNEKVTRLIQSSPGMNPELKAALQESADVNRDCRQALLEHVYTVSHEMNSAEGRRYIEMMQQRIVDMGHQ